METQNRQNEKLALLLGLFFLPGWAGAWGASGDVGWKFDQVSDFYGKQTAYLGKKGIRLTSEKMGITFVMTAPDWRVSAYNVKNKTSMTMPYAQWRKNFFGLRRVPAQANGPLKKGGAGIVGGVKACQYFADDIHRPFVKVNSKIKQPAAAGKLYNTEFWVAPDIKPPLPLTELLTEAVSIPNGMGLPVRMIQYNSNGRALISLDTRKCQRMNIDPAVFAVPKGYKKVKDEMMLLLNEDSDSDLAGLLGGEEGLGFSREKPASRKRSPR